MIWNKSLGNYVDRSLAEIRQLRTHGEKRVRVVLEVEYERVMLLGVRPVEPRQSLDRPDPREGLVHVHSVYTRRVETSQPHVPDDHELHWVVGFFESHLQTLFLRL